jgi:hypothetical protein
MRLRAGVHHCGDMSGEPPHNPLLLFKKQCMTAVVLLKEKQK